MAEDQNSWINASLLESKVLVQKYHLNFMMAAASPTSAPQAMVPLSPPARAASQAKLKVPAAPMATPPALSPAPAADKERASEGDSSDDEPVGSDSEKEAENSSSVEEEEEEEEEEEDSEDGDFIDDASDSD